MKQAPGGRVLGVEKDEMVVVRDPAAWAMDDLGKGGGDGGGRATTNGPGGAKGPGSSIYGLYQRRYLVVILTGLANFMVPFADILFFPAVVAMMTDLKTSPSEMAATLAVPMFTSGAASLLWGPAADWAGRRPAFYAAALGLLGSSVGSALAPSVIALIVFRAIAGAACAGLLVTTNAMLADIYEPAHRGKWMGFTSVPALIAPTIGAPIGGALSVRFGWRSTFAASAVVCAAILAYSLFTLKETLQYRVLCALRAAEGDAAADAVEEAPHITKPKLEGPWRSVMYLFEASIAPYALIAILSQAAMIAAVAALPGRIAVPPYSLDASQIGLAMLPVSLGSLIASPFGGILADLSARRLPAAPSGRMLPGALCAAGMFPVLLVAYGWLLQTGGPLAGVLAVTTFIGMPLCIYMPGLFSFMTILKQAHAGAANGIIQSATHIMQGVLTQVTPLAIVSMGFGGFLTLLAALVFVNAAAALLLIWRDASRAPRADAEAPPP
ncbi:MAG: major facilitator superfamily domain-containing protein [Monoraphidium minutum]|nr:MAG: major facilitator superfamily domain-containing protein [Monoraphidium minutum]